MKAQSRLRQAVRSYLIILMLMVSNACGESTPPVITVGVGSFTEDELLGLSPALRTTLAQLTALALAVADSSTDQLGEPLLEKWENDRLLDIFAAELTLMKNGVDDAVLEAHYLTDPEWELTVRHILFFPELKGDKGFSHLEEKGRGSRNSGLLLSASNLVRLVQSQKHSTATTSSAWRTGRLYLSPRRAQ